MRGKVGGRTAGGYRSLEATRGCCVSEADVKPTHCRPFWFATEPVILGQGTRSPDPHRSHP